MTTTPSSPKFVQMQRWAVEVKLDPESDMDRRFPSFNPGVRSTQANEGNPSGA